LSPRETSMRQTFSRKSRRDEEVRKGSTLERGLRIAHCPALPRGGAAAAAAPRTLGGKPTNSSSRSSRGIFVPSSARPLLLKAVNSPASFWLYSDSLRLPSSSSLAPDRAKVV